MQGLTNSTEVSRGPLYQHYFTESWTHAEFTFVNSFGGDYTNVEQIRGALLELGYLQGDKYLTAWGRDVSRVGDCVIGIAASSRQGHLRVKMIRTDTLTEYEYDTTVLPRHLRMKIG